MKTKFLLNSFSFFVFSSSAFCQSVGVGVKIGSVMPLNKVEYLNQKSNFISYPNIPSVSADVNLSIYMKSQDQILIYIASYGQQISAKFKQNGRVVQRTVGSSNINYGIKYYYRIARLKALKKKWVSYFNAGLNLENNVNRYVNFPSGTSKIYLYDFKRRTGVFPQIQLGYSFERIFRRTALSLELFGNFGVKYNAIYYFSSDLNNMTHKAIVKKKGDFVSFSVRYSYLFNIKS